LEGWGILQPNPNRKDIEMVVFLVIAGLLEVLFGFGVFTGAKSAIHEILSILAMGFGVLTFGLASILNEMQRKRAVSGLKVTA
jgi:hypothetical protein